MAEQPSTLLDSPSSGTNMSLEEFQTEQAREIQDLENIYLNQLCQELIAVFEGEGYGYLLGDTKLEKARNFIVGDNKLTINALPFVSDGKTDTSVSPTETLKKFQEQYASLIKESFLLIKAPLDMTDVPDNPMTQEDESHMRARQFYHFCRVFPGLSDGKHNVKEVEVHSQEALFKEVTTFQEEHNNYPILLKRIIFNGHGCKQGLAFRDEKGNGMFVNLDDFLQHIGNSETTAVKHMTHVVFAQCFGHCYADPKDSKLVVKSFTSDTKLQTFNKTIGSTDGLPDWEHAEIMEWAWEEHKDMNLDVGLNDRMASLAISGE